MKPETEAEPLCPIIDPATFDWDEHDRFIAQYSKDPQLSGDELEGLLKKMIESDDPTEKEALREAITRGFYGGVSDA